MKLMPNYLNNYKTEIFNTDNFNSLFSCKLIFLIAILAISIRYNNNVYVHLEIYPHNKTPMEEY